jgi:hypothetical protein
MDVNANAQFAQTSQVFWHRILYWNYPAQELVRIYRIQRRSEVYRRL